MKMTLNGRRRQWDNGSTKNYKLVINRITSL
jgi:hypothetical protein